jgi:hypothetical protein
LPDYLEIDTKIFMHDSITQAYYFYPFNLGMLIGEIFRQTTSSFTDDLKISNYCVGCFFITSKNPTPEGPALETPGRGYPALPPEGATVELPLRY